MVLVNDGSKDGTAQLIRQYSKEYTKNGIVVRGVSLLQNQGKGAAVKYVRAEYVSNNLRALSSPAESM